MITLKSITENFMSGNKGKKPEYKDDIIAFVKKEHDRRMQDCQPIFLQMQLNLNFVDGNQFCKVNTVSNKIEKIDPFAWFEEREIFNEIAPAVEARLAKLEKMVDVPKVRPATGENKDISKAKVSARWLRSQYESDNMAEKRMRADLWSEITGTGIYKTIWNPNKGRVIGVIEKEPEKDVLEEAEEFEKKETESIKKYIYEGDTQTIVVSPFEVLPEDINKPYDEQRSIIHVKVYTIDEFYDETGIVAKGKTNTVFSVKSAGGTGGIGQKGNGFLIETKQMENTIKVYEYSELPSFKYPDGRLIICTDDLLVEYSSLPYPIGEEGHYKLPYVIQHCIRKQGWFGDCVVSRMIPIQRRYNSIKNRKKEYLNRCTIGNLAYEEGSIDEELFEEEGVAPGDMLPYRAGYNPPQWISFHQLPNTFEIEEKNLLEEFNRLSGVSELSKISQAPSGIDSGVALSMLTEQDNTRIGLVASNYRKARIKVYQNWLYLFKGNVEYERIVRSVGKDLEVDIASFSADDINSFDIFFESESALAETLAQKRKFVFDLLNGGVFNDPDTGKLTREGRSKIFEMLQLGNWEDFDSSDNLHSEKAKRENTKLMQGQMQTAIDIDDDIIHIKIHNNYRLTSDYEDTVDPQLDQLFAGHVQQHLANLQAKAQAQQAQQAQAQAQMQQQEGGKQQNGNGYQQ